MSVFSKVYEDKMLEIQKAEQYNTYKTENYLRHLFYTMVISSFSYSGDIPKFIKYDMDFIEESLFRAGKVAYFEHEGEKYIAPCFGSGVLLKNGKFDRYTMIFRNGMQVIKPIEEIELCFNNWAELPSQVIVEELIDKCLNSLRAVDGSLMRAQLPAILALGDEQKLDVITTKIKNSYQHRDPYAIVSGDWIGDELKRISMYDNKEVDILALWDVFVRYKNLVFTTFGINNVEVAKTERLTQAESVSNTEITRYGLFYDMYEHRLDWVKRIKEHFGDEISCTINRNFDTVTELNLDEEDKIAMKKQIISPYAENYTEKGEQVNEKNDEV